MNKNLQVVSTDTVSILKKANFFIKITKKILKVELEEWVIELLKWADEKQISSDNIPRNRNDLLNLKKLNLYGLNLDYLPPEISQLKELVFIDLGHNNLKELPLNFKELKNLNFLSIAMNNFKQLPDSIVNLTELKNLWFNNNKNLLLSNEQLEWITKLKSKDCYIY